MLKILTSIFLFFSASTYAQSTPPEEAKMMMHSLSERQSDTAKFRTLLRLAKYQIFKVGENKVDLDSAAIFIRQAEAINSGLKSSWANGYILLTQSYLLKESGARDKAKETVAKALEILKTEEDMNLTADAYMELSGYYDYNEPDSLVKRIEMVKLAVYDYGQSANIQSKAASLQMLGDLYNIKGSSYIALQHLQAALDAYQSIGYNQVQGIYCLMGFIYTRLRDFGRGMDKQLMALKIAEAAGDSSMQLCEIYNYLGEIYNALTEREKAKDYYNKALEVAKKNHDVFATYLASVNIAIMWAALNKPDKALEMMKDVSAKYEKPNDLYLDYNISRCYINSYCLLKQFEKARPYANQLIAAVNGGKLNNNAIISDYTVAIRFFVAAGEDNDAIKYLEKHNEVARKLNNFYYLAANQKLRFMLDTARHNYKAAVADMIQFNIFNDSSTLQIKNRQIDELQVQFETDKKRDSIVAKDKDIQLLTKQSQLQKTSIQNGRLIRNFMIAAAALLLLILALVYRQYIIKNKNNRILRAQQSQINNQNISLHHLLDEKDWLLKEIHHRVKNNLQIVMSLLNSQSAYIDNEPALTAIHDSQHRVHAMSLIHQKLYNTENVSSIDMSIYIRELTSYLADSYNSGQRIRFEFTIEPLEMDVSQAVPLGLILNEAITNSIKYAFPDNREGVIKITLSNTSANHHLLEVSDNGIGMPDHFTGKKTGSLGMSLMEGLSEDLDGNFSIENNRGTIIKISFIHDSSIRRRNTVTTLLVSNN